MDNEFEKCLEELEELLEESWNLPIANNKYIINGEKLRAIISNIKLKLPSEMKRSKELLAKRDEIMLSAQNEAKNMIEKAKRNADLVTSNAKSAAENYIERAKVQAETLVNQEEIVRIAEDRANEIIDSAKQDALKMRKLSIEYIQKALSESERSIEVSLNAVVQAQNFLNGQNEK